ncbi:MAG: aminotransferase class III-fold pyridoxal phosphate-dependent enzyme [Xanthobacteraceae bacterium]
MAVPALNHPAISPPPGHAIDSGSKSAAESWQTIKDQIRIVRAENDLLFDEQDRELVDLFSGNGTVWLGHKNRRINARVAHQLDQVWITGGLETTVRREAVAAIERFIPASHKVAALYSTGMEASEFAIRMARVITGKPGVVGFEKSMHGKSLATAFLGWDNHDGVMLPQFHRLPYLPALSEPDILERLETTLRLHPISLVFIEPLQGTGGGYSASDDFYRTVFRLCEQHGALLAFDEILTGFYRTGTPFYFSRLGFTPHLLLLGKGIGNGFPVSSVAVDRRYSVLPQMLPGSTYAGNPLAAAAVVATLGELDQASPLEKVRVIERTITEAILPLARLGLAARGCGAMWIIELPPESDAQSIALKLYTRGIFASYAGRILRLLPALTIAPQRLSDACGVVQQVLGEVYAA